MRIQRGCLARLLIDLLQQFIAATSTYLSDVDAVETLACARDHFRAWFCQVHAVEKIAGSGETVRRQLVGIRIALGRSKSGDPLIEIERRPVEALNLTTREAAAVRRFDGPECPPELRHGGLLRETPERRVEAAEDAISADAGAEGVLGALRSDEYPVDKRVGNVRNNDPDLIRPI